MADAQPDIEKWIDVMADALSLPIADEFRPGIEMNLKTAAKMAALLESIPLDDEAEAAPVYRA